MWKRLVRLAKAHQPPPCEAASECMLTAWLSCIIDMVLRDSPQAVYNQTVAFLKAGGYDGSFAYVTGPDAGGCRRRRRRWAPFRGFHATIFVRRGI